jgi:hypothetical protein
MALLTIYGSNYNDAHVFRTRVRIQKYSEFGLQITSFQCPNFIEVSLIFG